MPSRRDDLIAMIRGLDGVGGTEIAEDTSLIASGILDSLALFRVVLWIEKRIGAPVDAATVNLPDEWDTVRRIVAYVETHRGQGKKS